MKKFVKIGLILGMMVMSLGTYAANVATISLSVVKGESKAVNFAIDRAENVAVILKNENGVSVYSENIKAKNGRINRKYDLSYLPAGVYYLEAETTTKIETFKIDLSESTTVENKAVKEVFKPVLYSKEGNVMLQLLNLEETPVSVSIYDVNNNLLYQQEFTGEMNFSKKFALKRNFSSNYTFVIKYNDTTFTKDIAL